MRNDLVLIRGAGRVGTAVAHRLRLCGLPVVLTEAARPTLIHRRSCFGSVIYESEIEVEGVPARRSADADGLRQILERGFVPVLTDPPALVKEVVRPWVLVDATGLERNIGTRRTDAPIVVGVGRGFTAGGDVHAVVESRPGQRLGALHFEGALPAEPVPGPFGAPLSVEIFSPGVGRFEPAVAFGAMVRVGDALGRVGARTITAPLDGLVSGLLAEGLFVAVGARLAEVDPRGDSATLLQIDPRARAVAGGVLEAILYTAAVGLEPGQSLTVRSGSEGGGEAPAT